MFLIILTVLGFTWIFALVALTRAQNVILITIIVVMNASQPIFVSIAFIGTKKVLKEYLRLCRSRKGKEEKGVHIVS